MSVSATSHLLRPGARFAVGAAGDAHQSAHALGQEVVAGARCVGTGLAKAGDRAVDEPGIQRLEARVSSGSSHANGGFGPFLLPRFHRRYGIVP